MNKKGKGNNLLIGILAFVFIVVLVGSIYYLGGIIKDAGGLLTQTAGAAVSPVSTLSTSQLSAIAAKCTAKNTDTATITTTCFNIANTTGGSTADTVACSPLYYYIDDSGEVSKSQTTSPLCGGTYRTYLLSNNVEGGNTSYISEASLSGSTAKVSADHTYVDVFFPSASHNLVIKTMKFGNVKAQALNDKYVNFNANKSGVLSDTGYQNRSTDFESTTNGVAISLGPGESTVVEMRFVMNESDRQFAPLGFYNSYNMSMGRFVDPSPTVYINRGTTGVSNIELKGGSVLAGTYPFSALSTGCNQLFSSGNGDEFVYYTPAQIAQTAGQYTTIKFTIGSLNTGIDLTNTDNPTITLTAVGSYQDRIASNSIFVDACDNAASSAAVYTQNRWGFILS